MAESSRFMQAPISTAHFKAAFKTIHRSIFYLYIYRVHLWSLTGELHTWSLTVSKRGTPRPNTDLKLATAVPFCFEEHKHLLNSNEKDLVKV